jgi:ribose transport system permease protein
MASILKWGYSESSWQSPAWAAAIVTLAIAGSVASGMATGAVNGALISSLRVVPFIITLGTMTAFLGLGKVLAANSTVRPAPEAVPEWLGEMVTASPQLQWLAYPLAPNFAWGVWLAFALAMLLGLVLHLTVFGRHVFAVGSNEQTARLCGAPVAWVKVRVYALAGLFVGAAGVYQFARLSSGSPTSGTGLELRIIAAVVIGGGSLNGGRGSVIGTLAGAAIMQTIAAGCTALGLSNPIQDIIIGVIIITAVALDRFRGRQDG